jgi:hypothetical protein
MSGFSPDWLALREPVDHASINAELRRAFLAAIRREGALRLVDIGCGTGSNMRGLAPWLDGGQTWTLLDYDARLLNHAAASATERGIAHETRHADLSSADLVPLFAGADAITSAAFFDLASQAAIDRIAEATVAAGAVFYTVLTYDGIAAWLPETDFAGGLRTGFNRHQTSDKGLGPALGPAATDALTVAFERRGYRVATGPSPWVITARHAVLRKALDEGWATAAVEAGGLAEADADGWLATRRDNPDAATIVGHQDLLALPA